MGKPRIPPANGKLLVTWCLDGFEKPWGDAQVGLPQAVDRLRQVNESARHGAVQHSNGPSQRNAAPTGFAASIGFIEKYQVSGQRFPQG